MTFVNIAKVSEIPAGTMKHVEAGGIELCVVNVNGKIYAIGDRCGHENARLSAGRLADTTVTCPMHFSKFDVTTGKKVGEPVLEMAGIARKFEGCPEQVKKEMGQMFQGIVESQKLIRTYDLPVFEVKVDGSDIQVNPDGRK